MNRSLFCLAAFLTAVAIAPEGSALAEDTAGAPHQNMLASTAPAELPPSVRDVEADPATAVKNEIKTTAVVVVREVRSGLDGLIAHHAAANNVPEILVRRIIKRESRGNARAISKGNYGLMQIRLGTARALGYRGGVEGLLDADTNMTYAVKYLAGAYQAAGGNQDRAVHYYAAGYYYAAKHLGLPTPGSNRPLDIIAINTVGPNVTGAHAVGAVAAGTQKSPAKQ